jgi:HSP20 family protein
MIMSYFKSRRAELSALPAFGALFGLRDELHRLVQHPLDGLAAGAQFLSIWNPAIDLYEDKDNVFVKAELPGLKREEIDVSLEDGVLSISGERKAEPTENTETRRSERFVGRFHRTVTLPSEVKHDAVTAQYKDGILSVTLPKVEAAKPKHIEVKIN